MPSCNTLEAMRRSKRESRRERRERSSHNGQRHERMGATVRHHYYQQMESKEWWNSTAYCNMAAAAPLLPAACCWRFLPRLRHARRHRAPHDAPYVAYELVASKQPASRQPTRHISAAMSMYEHDGKRHVRYLPFIRNIRYDIRGIVFPFHAPALAGEVSKRAGP